MRIEADKEVTKITSSWGTVKGRLERYDNHGDSNIFWLYTALGTTVKCKFPDDLVEKSASSAERNISVTGMLKHRSNEPMPYECTVEKIEIHEPDDQLPELKIGMFPDITEGESIDQAIQRFRDEWE